MIEIISNDQGNLLTVAAHGKVVRDDYEKVFIPAVEEKLKKHKKVRLLYHLGQDFTGYTLGAILDDAKLGVEHLTGFERIAIVTDVHWVSEASRFFGVFIPCPVRIFGDDKLSEAKEWLNAGQ
jgi:hypothetical protein